MLILPHRSQGDGHVHWLDVTPASNPCRWLRVQQHRMQSKSGGGGGLSKVWRTITMDPYASFSFRVITCSGPPLVLAVAKSREHIVELFGWLAPRLCMHPEPPSDLNAIMLRLINEQLNEGFTAAPLSVASSSVSPSSSSSSDAIASSSLQAADGGVSAAATPAEECWEVVNHKNGLVSLRSQSGMYLRADKDDRSLVNLIDHCYSYEKWKQIDLSDGRVAFFSCHNTYLFGTGSGGCVQSPTLTELGAWTRFNVGPNVYAFRSAHGKWLAESRIERA